MPASQAMKLCHGVTPSAGGQARPDSDDEADAHQQGRVFLLEDNEANAVTMSFYLKHAGYSDVVHVTSLAGVEEWRAAIMQGQFELIVLDVMLPDGTSYELMRELSTAGVKGVCAYTALSDAQGRRNLDAAGCQTVLPKPLLLKTFMEALSQMENGPAN